MFKSQKEFAQALLDGRKFKQNARARRDNVYYFDNGFKAKGAEFIDVDMDHIDWGNFSSVEEYREPQWYDNIPEEGVLCWVHNKNPEGKVRVDLIVFFDSIEAEGEERFQSCFANWKYATPLTKEEVMKFIYQGGIV